MVGGEGVVLLVFLQDVNDLMRGGGGGGGGGGGVIG